MNWSKQAAKAVNKCVTSEKTATVVPWRPAKPALRKQGLYL
jgi:hypothetical protein